MKTLLFLAALACSLAAMAMPNEKVLKNFHTAFPEADSVQWYDGADEYNVYFIQKGVRCRAWYDEDGNLMKSIRYYGESELPPIVIGSVMQKYPEQKVFGVTEYAAPNEFFYQITLEDEKKWYMVNSDASGNLTLIKKLNKGSAD